MISMERTIITGCELTIDERTVWLQANRFFGSMHPMHEGWSQNLSRAIGMIRAYTTANQLRRMTTVGSVDLVDLDRAEPSSLVAAEAMVTTNPDLLLHANPADCGELAVHGLSNRVGRDVIALIHASSQNVGDGTHLAALEYICAAHDTNPKDLTVRMSPSARVESYKFDDIDPRQKVSPLWRDYVYQDPEGMWHVDFHGRTVDGLVAFGIPKESIAVSQGDTVSDPAYFSWRRYQTQGGSFGYNGLLFAVRCNSSDQGLTHGEWVAAQANS